VQLTRLRLFQYRNLSELEIFPSGGISLFAGSNGQGKTNLLEAIYLLAYGKSFRTSTPRDCIQHGGEECRVEGTLVHGALTRDLQVSITGTEKKFFLLGKPVTLERFVGNLHLMAFTQEHVKVVRGGPADRRAFLDRAMVTLYPGHIGYLAAYGRSLKHRNKILASAREEKSFEDEKLLDSWDEALIGPGARILWNRLRYVELIKRELPQGLFGDEILKAHYLSSVAAEEGGLPQIEESFRRHLLKVRARDRANGYTSVGPHRDDLKLYLNGKSLPDFGSAGQQRSSLLALYFSQMEIHRKLHGFYPVFLVDDAEAELDPHRLSTFLDYLLQRSQTFLTSAKDFLIAAIAEKSSCYEVSRGSVTPLQRERGQLR
jgi:DNA replication and repair protein RecF